MIYGCDNEKPVPIATPTLAPFPTSTAINADAAQILEKAVEVTDHLQSYRYTLSAAPDGAYGDFVAPDKCRTVAGKYGTTIQIADRSYQEQPGESFFTEFIDPGYGSLCGDSFLQDLHREVLSGLTSARILGHEELDGHKVTHINFTYNASAVFGPGVPGASPIDDPAGTDIWIDVDTNYVLKLMPTAFEPEAYTTYSHFDEQIEPPIVEPSPDKIAKVIGIGTWTPQPLPTTVLPNP